MWSYIYQHPVWMTGEITSIHSPSHALAETLWSRHSIVCMWLGYSLKEWGFVVWFPAGKEAFSSIQHTDHLWCPISLLLHRCWDYFPWGRAASEWSWPHQHPLPKLRMREATSIPGPYAFTVCTEANLPFTVHVYLLSFLICRGDYQICDFENIFLCEVGV